MKTRLASLIFYLSIGCFILTWWSVAFRKNDSTSNLVTNSNDTTSSSVPTLHLHSLFPYLSQLSHDTLKQALSGDINLILQLITDWDIDAQILTAKGSLHIERLDADSLLYAHVIGRLLKELPLEKRLAINRSLRISDIKDDEGHLISVQDSFNRFLPQTFAAASILLAIAETEEILSIPQRMRDIPTLYAQAKLEKISQNLDGFPSEKLFLAKPHLTFITPYSHPPIVDTFRRQGLELFVIKNIDNFQEIKETILKIGHATNHPLEATLLSIFVDASMLAIDNRIKALHDITKPISNLEKILYLFENQGYSVPTEKCLAGQLIQRMLKSYPSLSCFINKSQNEWRVPIDMEKIVKINPQLLIISTPYFKTTTQDAGLSFSLKEIEAFQSKAIFYIDEHIQESPTQYIALAYFDLFQALASKHLP